MGNENEIEQAFDINKYDEYDDNQLLSVILNEIRERDGNIPDSQNEQVRVQALTDLMSEAMVTISKIKQARSDEEQAVIKSLSLSSTDNFNNSKLFPTVYCDIITLHAKGIEPLDDLPLEEEDNLVRVVELLGISSVEKANSLEKLYIAYISWLMEKISSSPSHDQESKNTLQIFSYAKNHKLQIMRLIEGRIEILPDGSPVQKLRDEMNLSYKDPLSKLWITILFIVTLWAIWYSLKLLP